MSSLEIFKIAEFVLTLVKIVKIVLLTVQNAFQLILEKICLIVIAKQDISKIAHNYAKFANTLVLSVKITRKNVRYVYLMLIEMDQHLTVIVILTIMTMVQAVKNVVTNVKNVKLQQKIVLNVMPLIKELDFLTAIVTKGFLTMEQMDYANNVDITVKVAKMLHLVTYV